jgi:hypothetical protein
VALPDSKDYKIRIMVGEEKWDTGKPKVGLAQDKK